MCPVASDQRVFERFPVRFPVKYEHSHADFGTNVFLRDASAQGVRVATKEQLFKNDHVSLLVKLPDGFSPLAIHGKVIWTKEKAPHLWETGLQFHKINLMEMQRMYKFIDS